METLDYDRTGNVVRRTSQDGCALDQVYDAMGRLVARYTSNEASCLRAPVADRFGYDARGLLVAAQNDSVGLIREYDALGRMLREIDTRFGSGMGYAYDKASRLTSKVYPDGSVVHYAYDGAGSRGAARFLGSGYRELAPGVFRSADGLRQFRMTTRDLTGAHGRIGPHVNFEGLNAQGRVVENLHVPLLEP